jgi:hypothetical protein
VNESRKGLTSSLPLCYCAGLYERKCRPRQRADVHLQLAREEQLTRWDALVKRYRIICTQAEWSAKRLYYVPAIGDERVAPFWARRPWHLNALKVRFLIFPGSWCETSSASGRIDRAFWPSHSAGRGPCGRISFLRYLLWGAGWKILGKTRAFFQRQSHLSSQGTPRVESRASID